MEITALQVISGIFIGLVLSIAIALIYKYFESNR